MQLLNVRAALAAGLAVGLFAPIAAAQEVVDQSQTSGPNHMAAFHQTDLAQSFQQAASNISAARILLHPDIGGGVADITITLYDNLPNQSGVPLASGTAFGVSPGDWAYASFGSAIPVIPDTTYYLVFTSSNSGFGIAGDINNPYPRGHVFANPGYQPFPNFDYTFETFMIIPEPGAATALLAGGLIALRRRVR